MTVRNLSPWLAHGTRNEPPDTLVLHATAGSTASGAIATLRDGGLSYHYLIEEDGTIHKCVPLSGSAYHAGSSYGPREEAMGVSRKQYANTAENRKAGRVAKFVAGCSVNPYSIGIAFVNRNDGHDTYSAQQTASALYLAKELQTAYPSLKWVTTHAIISPKRKSDPLGYDVDQFALKAGLRVWRFGA